MVHRLRHHFVFITKYRKPVLRGEIGEAVRHLTREICWGLDIEIVKGHVRPEHVHLLLDAPQKWSPSRVVQAIKGKTSHHLVQDYRSCARRSGVGIFGGGDTPWRALAATVSDEMVAKYIETQDAEAQDDDFRMTE